MSETDEFLIADRQAKTDSAVKSLLECGMYKGDTDAIEICLIRVGLDYEGALAIVKTLEAALWKRYDVDVNLAHAFSKLLLALGEAEEPEPDPRAGEDEALDDPRLR